MKFKFVKATADAVSIYEGKKASTGDVVEYEGFFAKKAEANPDFEVFEEVKPEPEKKAPAKKTTAKKTAPKVEAEKDGDKEPSQSESA